MILINIYFLVLLLSTFYFFDIINEKQALTKKAPTPNLVLEPTVNKKPQPVTMATSNIKAMTTKNEKNIVQKKQKEKTKNKKITVKNNITTEMITYKHWTGTYEPLFRLTVNGKKIEQGEEQEVLINNDALKVRYDYSFANGFKKGARIIHCSVEKETKNVAIQSFSWNSKWRIEIDQAKPQKAEDDSFFPLK